MKMKRKVIKLGQATYVASLPSKWIREHNLKKGDYLECEIESKKLIFSSEKQLKHKVTTIELPKKELFLKRLIYTPYRFGYDEIKIIYQDPELIKEIQEVAESLMGFEIVEQGEKHCTFRNISSSFEEEYNNIYRRIFLVNLNLMRDTLRIIDEGNFSSLQHLSGTQLLIDKLCLFCERVINKRGDKDFMKNSFMYITTWTLRQIGSDWFKDLCDDIDKKPSNKTINNIKNTLNLFETYFKLYYKPSLEGIKSYKENYEKINTLILNNLDKYPKEEIKINHHLLNIIDKINHIALPIQVPIE